MEEQRWGWRRCGRAAVARVDQRRHVWIDGGTFFLNVHADVGLGSKEGGGFQIHVGSSVYP
jgi:hypothetical protein